MPSRPIQTQEPHSAAGRVGQGAPTAAATAPPRLRADARRNRDRIVTAATRVFGELGADVPMEDIARAAGVGVGTLYRRFPDRHALVIAVVPQNLETLLRRSREARDGHRSAWDRIVGAFEYTHEVHVALNLLSGVEPETRDAVHGDPFFREVRAELLELLASAVRDAQADGIVRADVTAEDVVRLAALLIRDWSSTRDAASRLAHERAKGVVFDGLRCRSGDPLPGEP